MEHHMKRRREDDMQKEMGFRAVGKMGDQMYNRVLGPKYYNISPIDWVLYTPICPLVSLYIPR